MNLLILFLKVFGVVFGVAFCIVAGIVLAVCGIYLMSVGVIALIEFVDRKVGR